MSEKVEKNGIKGQIPLSETIVSQEGSGSYDSNIPGERIEEDSKDQNNENMKVIQPDKMDNYEQPKNEDEYPSDDQIRYSKTRFKAIIENSMDNIYICDSETGRIIETNRSMRSLLGYTSEELHNMSVYDILDHSDNDVDAHIGMVLENETLKISSRRYKKKDGSVVDIEATCSVLEENSRKLLCVISKDVSDRIRRDRMLIEERNRAELYLDILNHDIGNLHQGILGFIKLCRHHEGDQGRLNWYLQCIDDLTMRSVHLARNLKTLTNIKMDTPNIISIDPATMVSSCIGSVKKSIPMKDPEVIVDMPNGKKILAIEGIDFAFYNVIHNAVKYQNEKKPVVEITASETSDGFLIISVKDRGRGIPLSLQTEVFNREELNKKHGGLGLSVVRSLVEISGGKVWIEGNVGENGTNMMIQLKMVNYDTGEN
jgi:PAS domain S-box-containing protein